MTTLGPGPPTVRTPRLLLRAPEPADVEALFAIQSDAEAMRHTRVARDREGTARLLEAHAARFPEDGFAPWTAVLRSEGCVVGWGGLLRDPEVPQWGPEVAYFLHRGAPRAFRSSEHWVRYFCASCGCPVYQRHPTPPSDGSDLVCILIPSLDDPTRVRPSAHIWCSSRLPFFDTRDDLPRFADGRLSHPSARRSWRAPVPAEPGAPLRQPGRPEESEGM